MNIAARHELGLVAVLSAIAELVKVLPGYDEVWTNVNLHGCHDDVLTALVDAGFSRVSYVNDLKTEKWDTAELLVRNVNVTAYGKSRPIEAPADATEVSPQGDLRRALIPECAHCERPAEGYTIVSTSGRTNVGPLCGECHDSALAGMRRRNREAIEEGRGDYLRDQGKDGGL